jgi:hypothetical protein
MRGLPFAASLAASLVAAAPAPAAAQAAMHGALGAYGMTREASGTSWQPDSTPHEGLHVMRDGWMLMAHGFANAVYDRQGGPRGAEKGFSSSMGMLMARRDAGPGTLGLRAMASLDPAMGPSGYPLLLQTGETADGVKPLVDRQHPHDLFMELSASYSLPLGEEGSVFAYAGLPGEPALGPSAFMHRYSGAENPEAPLSHHWLDSTHIAYGVATLGYVRGPWKLDASAFKGREPDRFRWDVEEPRLDSWSGRVTLNPDEDWSLQASYGRLHSPEALEPGVDVGRFTASASMNRRVGAAFSQTTFAYGRNMRDGHEGSDAFLLEASARAGERHTMFARAERVDKDELFEGGDPLAGRSFAVSKLSLGYLYDFARWGRSQWGVGVSGAVHLLPAALRAAYGAAPGSLLLFARVKLL